MPLVLVYYLTLLEGPLLFPRSYGAVIGVLLLLAVLEIVLDKVRAVERAFNIAMVPVRAVSGALLFAVMVGVAADLQNLTLAAAASQTAPWLVAGAAVAGTVAVLKVLLRPPAKVGASGVSTRFLSVVEDVVALVGGIVGALIPFVPLLVVGFLLFFYFRIRRRRGRKYGGLRILGD